MASLARRHNATLTTSGAEAAKNAPHPCFSNTSHFNPRSPCEERRASTGCRYMSLLFQPTLPVRGATSPGRPGGRPAPISTHAPRAGSDHGALPPLGLGVISTHAPRAGSDVEVHTDPVRHLQISTHAPRAGSDNDCVTRRAVNIFQPTLPVRGATGIAAKYGTTYQFQPTLPVRGATRGDEFGDVVIEFQPTLPVRGATVHHLVDGCLMEISTHAPRAGSDETRETARLEHLISTHAPRAGSDRLAVGLVADQDISTHAPRAGSDVPISSGFAASQLFQPTLPVRGATARVPALRRHQAHFNPRSPCGERPFLRYSANLSKRFQPTLPVRGATGTSSSPTRPSLNFNPRSPCGERRAGAALRARFTKFQPTLPCGERPHRRCPGSHGRPDFNPRSPCGERLRLVHDDAGLFDFNPRSPCGERHDYGGMGVARFVFQPTLPVRGATPERYPARSRPCNFNPRSPCGERLLPLVGDIVDELISTHAPRAGSDITTTSQSCLKTSFQPTLPVRGATGSDAGPSTASDSFQPTLPVRGATEHVVVDHVDVVISTHAPRAGSDNMFGDAADGGQDFNPRSPCGERRVPESRMTEFALFQPTLPVRGATLPVNSRHRGHF